MIGSVTGWLVIAVIGAATIAIKAAGPVVLGGRRIPPRLLGVVSLLPAALLAALIATSTLGGHQALVIDARLAGVAAAAIAVLLRAPMLAVVVIAAAVTATLRAMGIG